MIARGASPVGFPDAPWPQILSTHRLPPGPVSLCVLSSQPFEVSNHPSDMFGFQAVIEVRFTPESGHTWRVYQRSAFDPKRTSIGTSDCHKPNPIDLPFAVIVMGLALAYR